MRVLVTGGDGFIGKNLLAWLALRTGIQALSVTRASTAADIAAGAHHADFVFHLAGVNRSHDVDEFWRGNVGTTESLCAALSATGRSIPIAFSSSIQAGGASPYGASKVGAEVVLEQYRVATGSPVYIYRLPNVFGKWCRPNYNSVVATFCHNIARDLPVTIRDAAPPLTLVYVDDVVAAFLSALDGHVAVPGDCEVSPVYRVSLDDLACQIRTFKNSRQNLITERVGSGLTRALYATFLSYLPVGEFAYDVPKYADHRGVFVEMLKTHDSGQFSFFTAHPGVTRGGHYHHSKSEKFLVIAGKARFRFRNVVSNETYELLTASDRPRIVETTPGWAHDITNVGDEEMIVMLWANEIFNRACPDTNAYVV